MSQGNGQRMRNRVIQAAEQTLEFIKIELPENHRKLLQLRQENRRKFRRVMTGLTRRYAVVQKLREKNSESYEFAVINFKLEIQIWDIKETYKNASESEKSELTIKMRSLLEQAFEMKTKIAGIEITKLEEKLKESKRKLDKQLENKDKAIELRLDQLLNEDIQW